MERKMAVLLCGMKVEKKNQNGTSKVGDKMVVPLNGWSSPRRHVRPSLRCTTSAEGTSVGSGVDLGLGVAEGF